MDITFNQTNVYKTKAWEYSVSGVPGGIPCTTGKMKLLLLICSFLVDIGFGWGNVKKHFPNNCPNNNLNIQQYVNPETTKNVMNWAACSDICRQRQDCNYWVWTKKITGWWAAHSYNCVTMSDYGYSNSDTNTVSGARDCEGNHNIIHIIYRMSQKWP